MKKFYNFYKVSRKLRLLMILEILLLTVSFILILFFYMQNYTTQQSNTIYHMNQSLLIQTNSVIEKMETVWISRWLILPTVMMILFSAT